MTKEVIEVFLTPRELYSAKVLGAHRQIRSVEDGRRNNHGCSNDPRFGLSIHILGAMGEMAAAKALNFPCPDTCDTFKAPDLGDRLQIRTRSRDWHALIVRPDDSDSHIFVLVTASPPRFVLRGWMRGEEAKNPDWWINPRGRPHAYFVPQRFLHPFPIQEEL